MHLITVNDYLARFHAEWMGRIHRWLGLDVGLIIPGYREQPAEKRAAVRLRHHLRHEQRVRLRLPARQHGRHARRQGPARPQLRHRRRGRLDPHRRGPHPADHLAAASPTRPSCTTSFASIVRCLQRDEDYEVDEEKRVVVPLETGIEQGRGGARHREPLRRGAAEPRAPAVGGAQGQGAVQAGQGLHHPERRGEDRRRVHRSHPRGPALVGGHPPGRRGQGGREDQGGEPDPRHDHAAELLPHVRQARRHDRHGPDRGGRADEHVRACGWCRSPRTGRSIRADQRRPDLQDRGRQVRRRRRRHRRAVRDAASRCSSARSASRRASTSSRLLEQARRRPRGAQRQAAHPGGARSSPRPAACTPSRSPPTWPVAASTSSSAATPRAWPATRWSTRATPRRAGRRVRAAGAARADARGVPTSAHRGAGPLRRAARRVQATSARPRATRCASSAGSTCSAPSATRAAASTTSSVAAPAVRATPARAASTSASTTS